MPSPNSTATIILRMCDFLSRKITRRRFLANGLVAGASLPLVAAAALRSEAAGTERQIATAPFTPEQDSFLDEVERSSFRFFWEQANPVTGLVRDRANVLSGKQSSLSSIAAVGFGLTAISIADARGYIPHEQATERVLHTLRFLWKKLPHHRGFFYHWAD